MKIQLQSIEVNAIDKKKFFFMVLEDLNVTEITEFQFNHIAKEPGWSEDKIENKATFKVRTLTLQQ